MPVASNLYVVRTSWLHAADPRVKLLLTACLMLLLLVFSNLYIMLFALALLHLIHLSARMPLANFTFIWKAMLPVVLLVTALNAIFYPAGNALLEFWIVRVTVGGLARGLALGLRIITMAFAVFALLYSTDPPTLVRGLVKLKMPYQWGLVLTLSLRYIPALQSNYSMIADAQQARGLDFSASKGLRRVRLMMPIFVAMVISSLRASEQLARALEARAFGASGVERSVLRDIKLRPLDYLLGALIIVLTLAALFARYRYGIGTEALGLLSIS